MPDILQLKEFVMTRLQVEWHEPSKPLTNDGSFSGNLQIDYDVLRNPEEPYSMALQLRIKIKPEKKSKIGYDIEAEVVGFFDFPETMPEEQVQFLIRVNGGTILYGILRGQVSLFTASFPGGKFMLPAVYMQDIVKEVEERRGKPKNTPKKKSTSKLKIKAKKKTAKKITAVKQKKNPSPRK